mgnify:CR=1 FL=1|tara:strand:- start:11192 stop:11443 length:252 start_codon:yes stop_codon:yes gene_type:complete
MTEIVDFLNNVTTKNFVDAEKQFSDLLNARLTTRLDDEKIKVANQVFNNVTDDADPEEVEDEVELSTETEVESDEGEEVAEEE